MKSIKIFSIALLMSLIAFQEVVAQSFLIPVTTISRKDGYLIKNDGTRVEGKITPFLVNGQVRSVTVKNEAGEKQKFKAAEIKLLAAKASGLAKLEMMAEATSNLRKTLSADFEKIANREYIIFEQALLPKKKDKPVLMQLLNPGFDSRIKVYPDPNAKETKSYGGLTGGDDKSYLVVKDGSKSMVIKKKKYKKEQFDVLFDDCPVVGESFVDKERSFWSIATHVFVFDNDCGKEGEATD